MTDDLAAPTVTPSAEDWLWDSVLDGRIYAYEVPILREMHVRQRDRVWASGGDPDQETDVERYVYSLPTSRTSRSQTAAAPAGRPATPLLDALFGPRRHPDHEADAADEANLAELADDRPPVAAAGTLDDGEYAALFPPAPSDAADDDDFRHLFPSVIR